MTRYINPLTDFGFKKLFGEEVNKELLIDFLNNLLPHYHQITNLSYIFNEKVGNTPLDRKAVYDLYCQNEKGDRFIVELQKVRQEYFIDRTIYYSTFAVQEQAPQGEWDFKLSAVYIVAVLDFSILTDNDEYLTGQPLYDKEDTYYQWARLINEVGKVIYKKLHYIFIELPRFTKQEGDLATARDKWLYVLRHLARLQDRPTFLNEQIYRRVFEIAELATFSREERYAYEESLKAYRDMRNALSTAKSEGKEEGRLEEKQKIAAILKREGQSLEFIQRVTGLSPEDITKL